MQWQLKYFSSMKLTAALLVLLILLVVRPMPDMGMGKELAFPNKSNWIYMFVGFSLVLLLLPLGISAGVLKKVSDTQPFQDDLLDCVGLFFFVCLPIEIFFRGLIQNLFHGLFESRADVKRLITPTELYLPPSAETLPQSAPAARRQRQQQPTSLRGAAKPGSVHREGSSARTPLLSDVDEEVGLGTIRLNSDELRVDEHPHVARAQAYDMLADQHDTQLQLQPQAQPQQYAEADQSDVTDLEGPNESRSGTRAIKLRKFKPRPLSPHSEALLAGSGEGVTAQQIHSPDASSLLVSLSKLGSPSSSNLGAPLAQQSQPTRGPRNGENMRAPLLRNAGANQDSEGYSASSTRGGGGGGGSGSGGGARDSRGGGYVAPIFSALTTLSDFPTITVPLASQPQQQVLLRGSAETPRRDYAALEYLPDPFARPGDQTGATSRTSVPQTRVPLASSTSSSSSPSSLSLSLLRGEEAYDPLYDVSFRQGRGHVSDLAARTALQAEAAGVGPQAAVLRTQLEFGKLKLPTPRTMLEELDSPRWAPWRERHAAHFHSRWWSRLAFPAGMDWVALLIGTLLYAGGLLYHAMRKLDGAHRAADAYGICFALLFWQGLAQGYVWRMTSKVYCAALVSTVSLMLITRVYTLSFKDAPPAPPNP